MRTTDIEPDVSQLTEVLKSYGHPEIRVPLNSMKFDHKLPWVAYITLLFDDVNEHDRTDPVDWRMRIIERLDVLIGELRKIGWVRVSGLRLTFDSEFEPPTCTLAQKLVKPGDEYGITASAEFELVPISGEIIE